MISAIEQADHADPAATGASRPVSAGTVFALAVIVTATAVLGFISTTDLPARVDGARAFTTAYNIVVNDVYSAQPNDPFELAPDHREPPGYPALLAVWITVVGDLGAHDLDCWLDVGINPCTPLQRPLKLLNVGLHVMATAVTAALALALRLGPLRSVTATAVTGFSAVGISYLDWHYTEPLAMLAMTTMTLGLALIRRAPLTYGLLSGGALAVLVLTKPMFLPFVVILPCLIALLLRRDRPSATGLAVLLAFAVATVPVAGWSARNLAVVEGASPLSLASNDSRVIQVRMAHFGMTNEELVSATVYWAGWTIGPVLAERLLPESSYRRLVRDEDNSFYQASRDLVDRSDASIGNLLRSGRPQWLLTPLFLWQGSAPSAQFEPPSADGGLLTGWMVTSDVVSRLLVAGMVVTAWQAVRRRDLVVTCLVIMPFGALALIATLTHALPRYSVPLFAVMVVLALTGSVRRRKEPNSTPIP